MARSIGRGRTWLVSALLAVAMLLALLTIPVSEASSLEQHGLTAPKASKASGSKRAKPASASDSEAAASGPGGQGKDASPALTPSAIKAAHRARATKLSQLGSVAKIRDAHTRFSASLSSARQTLTELKALDPKNSATFLKVSKGKMNAALRYVQRVKVKVALLNARHATVAAPSPFSLTSSVSLRSPAQWKKMINTRRKKGVKIPVRRLGQKPLVVASAKGNKANSKVKALKDKVASSTSASAADTAAASATGGKSKSVSIKKSKKPKKSLLQLKSEQTPHGGAGGVVGKSGKTGGGAGDDASKSGKTGGAAGDDASKSGKTGGADGGNSGKSGKTGGVDGGDSSKSGKTGGAGTATGGSSTATADQNAQCNKGSGGITFWSAAAAGQKLYKSTPGYVASPGDRVMVDGTINNPSPTPTTVSMEFNPRTGKCFTPITTKGPGGALYPGRCPSCPMLSNPAIAPGGLPWQPKDIHYDENDQICYGNSGCPPSYDAQGLLLFPFDAIIVNGHLQSIKYPSMKLNGQGVILLQRNQGDGSWCWANTAVELAEMAKQLTTKDANGNSVPASFTNPLSVATIVKCVPNQGSDGGSPIDALEWMKTHVLPTENHKDGSVTCPPAVPAGQGTIKSYVSPIPTCDHGDCSGQSKYEDELAQQVAIMPTLVYVDASQWASYKPIVPKMGYGRWDPANIIFPTAACSNNPDLGNHVLLIVGAYTFPATGKKYWVLLNSWGENWGAPGWGKFEASDQNGYIFLEYGVNACGLANFPVSVDMA